MGKLAPIPSPCPRIGGEGNVEGCARYAHTRNAKNRVQNQLAIVASAIRNNQSTSARQIKPTAACI